MTNRNQRSRIAQEAVEIQKRGSYLNANGNGVSIAAFLDTAKSGTVLIRPDELDSFLGATPGTDFQTDIQVINETTLAAARRCLEAMKTKVLCLNFASAMNPGGGFLGGSQAQEESLARASGLYECLLQGWDYYEANRACNSSLYTDHFIYSPDVPVFRDDDDQFLDEPYLISFLTAPAVNRRAVENNEPQHLHQVDSIMRRRINAVFAVAQRYRYQCLILGTWGCGVFQNNPQVIAALFAHQLMGEQAPYGKAFTHVQFAVLDQSQGQTTFNAFKDRLRG